MIPEAGQQLWENRYRIKDAYDSNLQNEYCQWRQCILDVTKAHMHLHREDTILCEWDGCPRTGTHLHKYKPTGTEMKQVGPYERVRDAIKEILGVEYEDGPLAKTICDELEEERMVEQAETGRKARRLEKAEIAGQKAAREFEQAATARRAKRTENRKKAREVERAAEDQRLKRRSARLKMRAEMETANELDGTFDPMDDDSLVRIHNSQLQLVRPSHRIGKATSVTRKGGHPQPSNSLGKRKRADSDASQTSSLTERDAAELDKLIQEETPPTDRSTTENEASIETCNSPQSETSDLTEYDHEELDAILEGVEVVVQEPDSFAHDIPKLASPSTPRMAPPRPHTETRTPTKAFSQLFLKAVAFHTPKSDRELMPPPPPRISAEEAARREAIEEQEARRTQIASVMEDGTHARKDGIRWKQIAIYEDPEDQWGT